MLQAIELAGEKQFVDAGLDHFESGDCIPTDIAEHSVANGLITVAVGADDFPVGWVLLNRCGDEACIGQISVHPVHQKRGIGSMLTHAMIAKATDSGERTIILNTERDIIWNRPWYESLGFTVVDSTDWTGAMADVVGMQTEMGLDWSTRVHMRLTLA